jgi:hypothetical protein
LADSRFPFVLMPSAFLTEAGSGWRGLPTAAFAISQRTAGEFFDSDSLARFDISLSRLTRAVTLFLTTLYLGLRPRESLLAISTSVSGQRYRGSIPFLTVILFKGAARSMPWTIPLLRNARTMHVRVPDLVYVSPGPGFEHSKESGAVELLEDPALNGLGGRGHLVD